jgi:archaellum component FlaC
MTDAALPVTQSAVEEFTERYLESLGGTIEKQGGRWEVTVPDTDDTRLPAGRISLLTGDDIGEEATGDPLHPESEFFQRILGEASERCPTGKLTIETDQADVEIPRWLKGSDVEVRKTQFIPYYDRTAVVVLFQVSIETVSEYQQAFLRAIAIDGRSEQSLPELEDTFLQMTSLTADTTSTTYQSSLSEADARSLLDTAQTQLMEKVQREIDEVHREASRAADAEIEEYRQMQQQRIEELEEERSKLSSRIDELSEAINGSDQEDRVEALKQRKRVKSEYEEVDSELIDLHEQRDQGYPQKQEEIRKRHALDVRVTPLTVTQVEYERGEMDIELDEEGMNRTVTIGYGIGIGPTEKVRCSSCDRELSAENYLQTIKDSLRCRRCTSSNP